MLRAKHKILVLVVVLGACLSLVSSRTVEAIACPDGFDGGSISQIERGSCANHQTGSSQADSEESADPSRGANLEADCKPANGAPLDQENCGIVGYIVLFTNVLSSAVGIVIIIMIAVGGVQYTTSGDDPQAVSAAKTRIRNAILALVFFLFTYAFLQWLIPGGLF